MLLITSGCSTVNSVDNSVKNFDQATSFDTVATEADVKGIVLFEACGETPQPIAREVLQPIDSTTLVSRTTQKAGVIGENTTQLPNWTLTATINADALDTLTENLKAIYAGKNCAATALIGDYIKGWNLEPSRKDAQGLWAADVKYLKSGEFETFRDVLVGLQPLYDKYGFETVARIINIEKVDLANPIENLEVPDIATMTYIANFKKAFVAYRADPRYSPLAEKRTGAVDKYVNFTGILEPKKN